MDFNYNFTTIQETAQIRNLIDFIALQDLGYPGYGQWVEKTEHELNMGVKGAILAYSEGKLAADLIFQTHKRIPRVVEIKNLRTHPDLRRKYFARFMLKQLESESTGYNVLLVDARESQTDMVHFLQSSGFAPILSTNLYSPNERDLIMAKPLT